MKKEPKILLEHIIESIEAIEKYTKGRTKEKFSKAKMMQDAIVRRIEIIGEAVKNLPPTFRKKHPKIAWQEIAGMRDVLIHEYFGVNINVVWETIRKDIPKLKKQI
ncbi:MAG: DUF86 domain-containing protein, partial [Candidatus Peregrinibacteria bacterium]